MEIYSTDEEQVAALKKWWEKNGNSLLIGIGLALLVVFGWKTWQANVMGKKAEASALYQQLMTQATKDEVAKRMEAGATVDFLAGELKTRFADTEYALYAAMFLAKEFAGKGELDAAIGELNYVLANTQDARLIHIINGRLARIYAAQKKYDEALALLKATDDAFAAPYHELTGDILLAKGDQAAAVESYKQAWALIKEEPSSQPMLSLKLADLGVLTDEL